MVGMAFSGLASMRWEWFRRWTAWPRPLAFRPAQDYYRWVYTIVHEQSVMCILQTQSWSPSPTSPFPPSLIFLTLPSPLLPSPLSFLSLPSSTSHSLPSPPFSFSLPSLPFNSIPHFPFTSTPPLYTFLTNFSDPLPHSRFLLIFHFLLLLLLFSPTPMCLPSLPILYFCLHLFCLWSSPTSISPPSLSFLLPINCASTFFINDLLCSLPSLAHKVEDRLLCCHTHPQIMELLTAKHRLSVKAYVVPPPPNTYR